MPFVSSAVPLGTQDSKPDSYGRDCRTITPGAGDQLDPNGRYFKYITAATAGDVTFTPYTGADGTTYTMTVAAGMILPGRIRRVTAATATLLGWMD